MEVIRRLSTPETVPAKFHGDPIAYLEWVAKNKESDETLQHQDCEECRLNIEIIGVNGDLISKQILQGMEKSGEQVAVHVNRKGELLSVMTIKRPMFQKHCPWITSSKPDTPSIQGPQDRRGSYHDDN